jgi:Oxygen evolving enhancer protein 3 (PsbQ)
MVSALHLCRCLLTPRRGRVRSRPVAVSASAEGRRAVLGGLLAGAIAIAPAAQAIEIIDATKVRDAGFDLIYQARDLDLPQVTSAASRQLSIRAHTLQP